MAATELIHSNSSTQATKHPHLGARTKAASLVRTLASRQLVRTLQLHLTPQSLFLGQVCSPANSARAFDPNEE
jgi:hypothetical protein